MNNGETQLKPKFRGGQKRKHVTDEERGEIKALLKLKIYSAAEIGQMVGRSSDAVEKVAKTFGIELLGQSRKSEEYKQRLAQMFGGLSEKMLDSLHKETPEALAKVSIGQRAMVAGIAADKLVNLTRPDETQAQMQLNGPITLSWVQLVQQNTPGRAKDGHEPAVIPAPKTNEPEDVTPVPVGDNDDGDDNFLE